MKTVQLVLSLLVLPFLINAQSAFKKLDDAIKHLEADTQMKHAILSLYVVNSKTGNAVYDKHSQIGLTAASSQKVITSVTALELLGTDYRYKTELRYDGKIENGVLNGNLYVAGNGDPTPGSWRYANTKEEVLLKKWVGRVKAAGIKEINGTLTGLNGKMETQTIPGEWPYDDIGNYYGAGISALNWHENQYDIILKPGKNVGDGTSIVKLAPKVYDVTLKNEVITGPGGSGDKTIVYLAPYCNQGYVVGSIQKDENTFTISGSIPNPSFQFISVLSETFNNNGIRVRDVSAINKINAEKIVAPPSAVNIAAFYSPPLDSINYWFLKKSVNLYGEAFVKTIALEHTGFGSAEGGLQVIKNFWKVRGIDLSSLNILDGSGLSPKNRITANALVTVLQYAAAKPWFSSFYNALPDINGIKMKSGSMGGVRSFTGYIKGRDGDYTFAMIINNYYGPAAEVVKKMYKVLDVLK